MILAPPFDNKMRVFAIWKCGGGELHLDSFWFRWEEAGGLM